MTKLFNTKINKDLRRKLRENFTVSEKIFWRKIKNRQLNYKFRRQYGIGEYIIDFCCPELKLIIEIDGATHGTEEEINYDKNRQDFLEKAGFKVVRYLNVDIKNNLSAVLENLMDLLKSLGENNLTSPHPLLVKEREPNNPSSLQELALSEVERERRV